MPFLASENSKTKAEDLGAKLWFLRRQDGVTFRVQDDMTHFLLDERPGKRRTGKFVDLVTGVCLS